MPAIILRVTVSFDITFDRRYVAAATRATFGNQYWLILVMGALALVCTLGTWSSERVGSLRVLLVALTIVCVLLPELIILTTVQKTKSLGSRHVTITEDGLTSTGPDSTGFMGWAAFPSARETAKFWLLKCPTGGSTALPKEKFSAEESDWFEALLRRRGLLKG